MMQEATVWRAFGRAFIVLALLAAAPAHALDPTRRIEQFHHTVWTQRDGVPAEIYAISQTPDGFLWLGSTSGLYRFDGVSAEPYATDAFGGEGVVSLAVSANGDLWAGLDAMRIARVRRGEVITFDLPREGAFGAVYLLSADADGSIWIATRDSVFNFDGQRWRVLEAPWPPAETWSQPGGVWGMDLAPDGTLWAKNLLGLYYLRRGADAFVQAPGYAGGLVDFVHDTQGRLWTADFATRQFYELPDLPPDGAPPGPIVFGAPVPPTMLGVVYADSDGAIWNANRVTGGLHRIASLTTPAPAEELTVQEGLGADIPYAVFEDREGTIWVATAVGLERFRHANIVVELGLPVRTQAAHLLEHQDGVLLYSGMSARALDPTDPGQRLFRMRPGRPSELLATNIGQLQGIAPTPDGGVVFASEGRLHRWRDGAVTPMATPREIEGGHVVNLVAARDGALWVSVHQRGAFRVADGQATRFAAPSIADTDDGPLIALDAEGAAWLFYSRRTAARVENNRVTEFPSLPSTIGLVNSTVADRDGFFIAGNQGIARFDDRAFQYITVSRAPVLAFTFGIRTARDGNFWLATQAGVLRIERESLLRAFADPDTPLEYRLYDDGDGFLGAPARDSVNHAMAIGPDGRIWVMSSTAMSWIDPARLYRNEHPPPVVITSVVARGRSYDMPENLSLPAGTSRLEIDYTALSLSAPERVRFRYRLIGVDRDWIEAGERREAVYTNVGPGQYQFQLIAVNGDGVWNTTGATLTLSIEPTFLQSIWFKLLVALALLGATAIAYAFRLRQVTAQLQSRFDIRVAERERIARELHDTLLQGVQGLLLRFQAIANRVPQGGELRTSLNEALDRADQVLVEGRARVRDLRMASAEGDLAKAILECADKIIEGDQPRLRIVIEGAPRPLHALVGEEVTRIAEEAIRNAVQHASAQSIDAVLSYGRSEFRLSIRDDGVGMSQAILISGEKAGHYGLIGMRERAQRIGGCTDVRSREGAGTEITLSIPGRGAYRHRRGRILRRLWPHAAGGDA